MRALILSRRTELRLARARAFLSTFPGGAPALIISPSFETSAELVRSVGRPSFGWTRTTLYRHALELARPALLARGLTAVSSLSLEALWARVAFQLGEAGQLERLSPLQNAPGLSRALAQTIGEIRQLELDPSSLEPALQNAIVAYERALADVKLADRADVLRLASAALRNAKTLPLVMVDVGCSRGLMRRFAQQLIDRSEQVLVTQPDGEEVWVTGLERADLGVGDSTGAGGVIALQERVFAGGAPPPPKTGGHEREVEFFSAPGEARECVEIARRMLEYAAAGVPFDRMAVFLRSPGAYRAGLEDAFRRSKIPAWFSSGLPRPDPSGRALLALLSCADERLSARRFGEYLSLSQVPQVEANGAPPAASEPFVRPDAADTLLPLEPALAPEAPPAEDVTDVDAPSVLGQLRAPRKWERLIIDAAVIGGPSRWRRRLSGLRELRVAALQSPTATEGRIEALKRELRDLEALEQFALPILDLLAEFPRSARWEEWIVLLRALATRALKFPERVLAVLNELEPMAVVGPIGLPEVRRVLKARLAEVTDTPEVRRFGRAFVAPTEAARGLSFDVVFVPGLAERVFPQKLREDPLLLDAARVKVSAQLETATERIAAERLALLLSIGAAQKHVVLSWPRVDAEHARPRVPSFYALECAQAVQGQLSGFEALQRQAENAGKVRLAWPAPDDPARAIDDTEFDLAVLHRILHAKDPASIKGQGRYLVTSSPHLGRALRARFSRWQTSALTPWDGLVKPGAAGRTALENHHPTKRPFSPTALEQYAACPYRFFLSALVRLEPLEIPGELEELGPLEKGSMAHAVQFQLLTALRADGIRVTKETLEDVFKRLHETIKGVSEEFHERYLPAIERVWQDGVQLLEADLRQWLRLMVDDAAWAPTFFELSFGLSGRTEPQDPASSPNPVTLVDGFQVRGSIDLVERRATGALRATDYKTGRARAHAPNIIGGGRHIQPLLYALVLEKLFPDATVEGGRLFYTTQIGEYSEVPTELNSATREEFGLLTRTLRSALETGFFPAMPAAGKGECDFCRFRALCGPDEERRVVRTRKAVQLALKELTELRKRP